MLTEQHIAVCIRGVSSEMSPVWGISQTSFINIPLSSHHTQNHIQIDREQCVYVDEKEKRKRHSLLAWIRLEDQNSRILIFLKLKCSFKGPHHVRQWKIVYFSPILLLKPCSGKYHVFSNLLPSTF